MPLCPQGHSSADSDFCDRCGIAISATAPTSPGQTLVRQGDLPGGSLLGPPASPSRYEITRRLGQGGFGTAYLAVDTELGRRCVVKELLPGDLGGAFSAAERERMFLEEAQMLAVLHHPSLPSVTDYFQLADRLYMAMSLEEGQPMSEVGEACGGRLPESEAIKLATDMGLVLGYLHDQPEPIVHRDISPDNIIRRPDGTFVLLDFGAARFYKPGQSKDTMAIGKLGFASPEVANGKAQSDGRSDLYSLGAVLYRVCVNYDPTTNPFQFPALGEDSGLSAPFRSILEKLVRTQRDQRFGSAHELVLALQGLTSHQDRCSSCGRPISSTATRCACGRSLLPPQAWATLGGDAAHAARPRSPGVRWKQMWVSETGQPVAGGAIGSNGVVVTAGEKGAILGRDVQTGRTLWLVQVPSPVGEPSLLDGHIAVSAGLDVCIIDPGGRISAKFPLGGTATHATPSGTLLHLVASDGTRWELDRRAGTLSPRTALGFEVRRGPTCVGDRVYFAGPKGEIACFTARSDALVWSRDLGSPIAAGGVAAGRTLVFAGMTGAVIGINPDTGNTVGECAVPDQILATPCVAGQTLVVIGRASLVVIDLLTWRVRATHSLPAFPRAMAPVLVGDTVFFADLARGTVWSVSAATGTTERIGSLDGEATGWAACVDGWVILASRIGRIMGVAPNDPS